MATEELGMNGGVVWSGWLAARDTLRSWREDNCRKSDQTLELGRTLLESYSAKLGSEEWEIHDQVVIAALDCGDISIAERSLQALQKRFPDSMRVKRLEGMLLEAKGENLAAMEFYNKVLEEHPTNNVMWKRKIAVYKATGDTVETIKELTKYLEVFMSDNEAWMELADLYIEHNDYDKAAFCLEELVLASPHHHLYHQRYAEVCYTLGTVEGLEVARKHYATALKLNPDNIRALYGFTMASHAVIAHPKTKSRGEVKAKNTRYIDWSKTQLRQRYQELDSEKLRVVDKMLDNLTASSR